MHSLTIDNVNEHCCTCLTKVTTATNIENMQEQKNICINISENKELLQLLEQCVVKVFEEFLRLEYMQQLCIDCFDKLQEFMKFRKRAIYCAEKLKVLYDNNNKLTKVEIENDEEQVVTPRTYDKDTDNNADIYKLMLKDTLLETEAVLIENLKYLANVAINDPDPFEATTVAGLENSKVEQELSADDNSVDADCTATQQFNEETSTSADTENAADKAIRKENPITIRKLGLRSNKPAITSKKIKNLTCTRKRRTKKEMEEFRRMQAEKLDSKFKRRNKGTKNTFKCSKCNHSFARKITLDAHVRKVHEGNTRPYQCDRCEKSYTFIGGLYTHIKEIHETVVRSYTCDHAGCERVYTSFVAMQKHKRLKHTADITLKKYVCEQCGTTFNQSGNLKYHRRTKHPTAAEQAEKEQSKERYECTLCKKLFHSRYTLKYHTLQLHTNETKYECNVCGRRLAKKFMLVQHMLVHSTEKLPCEHCGKQFIRKFELEAHVRAVHMKLKPFECVYCFERFASRKTLRHHEFIHTGEKPYVCETCGQAYRQQTCLKNHRKTHEKMCTDAATVSTFLVPSTTTTTAATTLTLAADQAVSLSADLNVTTNQYCKTFK